MAVAATGDRLVHHAKVIVNANIGCQAMVVDMRHFSRSAGCRLVAEGVDTEEQANTLGGLGVESSSAPSSDALSRLRRGRRHIPPSLEAGQLILPQMPGQPDRRSALAEPIPGGCAATALGARALCAARYQ